MPDEDMDITTDFDASHGGPTEDIDIDLDFLSGQQDEDLELGDFNGEDIQNFNSDTRDELMAEDEDTSFAMVDVDEINYNDSAAAANDYEIDIGAPPEGFWQQDDATIENDGIDGLDEINYAEDIGNQDDNNDDGHANEESGLQGLDAAQADDDQGLSEVVSDEKGLGEGVNSLDFAAGQESTPEALDTVKQDGDIVQGVSQGDISESNPPNGLNGFGSGAQDQDETQPPLITTEEDFTKIDTSTAFSDAQNNQEPVLSNGHDVDEDQFEDDLTGGQDHESDQLNHEQNITDHYPSEAENPVWVQESAGFDDEDDVEEASGEVSAETAGDTEGISSNSLHDTGVAASDHRTADDDDAEGLRYIGTEVDEVENEAGDESLSVPENVNGLLVEPNTSTDLTLAGAHHRVLVSYGETEYRLFAKSEDDDPNEYFLSDTNTLQLPLSGFLSNLRDVISEELSPLDELVIHIDGLGLEFGETTNSDFLESNSFGDILTIWDILVQNDDEHETSKLQVHLIVRPNCSQRLATLVSQANSGRSLTDVAVYRETTVGPLKVEALTEPELSTYSGDDQSFGNDEDTSHEKLEGDAEEAAGEYEDSEEITTEGAKDSAVENNLDEGHLVVTPSHHGKLPLLLANTPIACNQRAHCGCDDCYFARIERDWNQEERTQAGHYTSEANNSGSEGHAEHLDSIDNEHYLTANGADADADVYNMDENQDQALDHPTEADAYEPNSGEASHVRTAGSAASHSSSGTATLNGDDKDEIDYTDGTTGGVEVHPALEIGPGQDNGIMPIPSDSLQVPDDEITWESDNEDPGIELTKETAKDSVQVSPSAKKRERSATGEQRDAKRHRSVI